MTREREPDRKTVAHTLQGYDLGAAVTALPMTMDGLVTAGGGVSVNPGFSQAARLVGIFTHSACGAVNVAGTWTLRLRKNETGVYSATFVVTMAALPGSKDFGPATVDVVMLEGETYHVQVDGPSRNIALCRVVLTWELL